MKETMFDCLLFVVCVSLFVVSFVGGKFPPTLDLGVPLHWAN